MRCYPRYLLWFLVALMGTGNILTACGQKGDLYLPDDEPLHEETQAEERKK